MSRWGRPSVSGPGTDEPFRVAFILLALVLLVPLAEALLLDRTAGDAVTGHAARS